jgi:HPt (histidine-containing phosphotransfer) domain-containing protein
VRELNLILKKFVRDKQPPEVIEAAQQAAQLAAQQAALKQNGGKGEPTPEETETVAPELAEIFVRDTRKAIATIEAILEKRGSQADAAAVSGESAIKEEDLRMYTITVHGLKSALANIGETTRSSLAARLEQAGRDKNTAMIFAETPALIAGLREISAKLAPPEEAGGGPEITEEDLAFLREKLLVIKSAGESFDQKTARKTLAEIRERQWPADTREQLGSIAENLLSGDFDEVSNTIAKMTETLRQ